jgi:GNAT superfamily N-acetyltransferase
MLPPPSMPVVIEMSAVGRRVVVRFRRTGAALARAADQPLSDAVGDLVAHDGQQLTVLTRSGPLDLLLTDVVAARLVAPDRGRILALEGIAARGWQAAEQVEVDGWLLRANGGWSSRANSVLPLATPAGNLDDLLSAVAAFYRDRGLPAQIQLPVPARAQLDAQLAKRDWTKATEVLMLTRRLTLTAPLTAPTTAPSTAPQPGLQARDGLSLVHESVPSEAWQSGYHARDGQLSAVALGLLMRHPRVTFLSARIAGAVLGIARGTLEGNWLGVSAVEVELSARRGGVATALMASLERWATERGATHSYLQVAANNARARSLYTRLGYAEHHRYHYRQPPA